MQWGFPGVMERPVAEDLNRDGVTDIGLFVPTSLNSPNNPGADWYILVSQGTPVTGTINTLAHPFDDSPFTSDVYYHFGNGYFQPLVGIWDPPMPAATPAIKLASGTFTDVDVSAELGSVPSGGFAGLIARDSANGNSEYLAGVARSGNSYSAQIKLLLNGKWQTLASTALGSFTPDEMLSFEVVGTTLDLSLGDNLIASAVDSHLQGAGSAGNYSSPGSLIWPATATTVVHKLDSLPYSNNFTQANGTLLGTDWNQYAGAFTNQNGAAVGQAATNLATLYGVTTADVLISAAVSYVPLGGFAGLVSRYNSTTGDMYRAGITASYDAKKKVTDYTAQIWRKLNGKWTLLAAKAVSTSTGSLTFETEGSSQELFLNGILIVSSGDATLKTGSVGMYATTGIALSNFSASQATLTKTSLPFSDNFSTGTALASNWYNTLGGFAVSNGTIQGVAATNVITVNGALRMNVSVQAQLVSLPAGTSAGLFARYDPTTGNTYEGDIVSSYNARTKVTTYTAQIRRRVNGVWKVLFSTTTGVHPGLLLFTVNGDQLSLSLNGKVLGTVLDWSVTTAGTVGLTGGQGSEFSEFSAQ